MRLSVSPFFVQLEHISQSERPKSTDSLLIQASNLKPVNQ
jgi:hypothetical protein